MQLTPELAQGIVNQTMNVLGKNINIIDDHGIIIGSGNKKRVNTFHEGAVKVLRTGNKYIVSEREAKKYEGVEPGINLPVKFNDEIIGVVGITGLLEEVESYGEIVKNLVELMLSYDFLQKEVELEKKAVENYYQQLLSDNIKINELFKDRAKMFNIDLELYRSIMVIKTQPVDHKLLNNEIQNLSALLELENQNDILFIRGENLIFVKSFQTNDLKKQYGIIKKMAVLIKNKLEMRFKHVEIGVGQTVQGVKQLHLSYEGARHALEIGEKIYKSNNGIHFLDDLGYDFFIPYIEEDSADYYLHHMMESDIAQIFEDTDIGKIIESLVENNLNISKTADALFIHRNTLLYRLNKLQEITGFDPKNAKYLFALLLAYHLYLYKQN